MREAVLVVEDDPFVRRGVVRQINASSAFHVVDEASDVTGARSAIESGRAQVGVFDLELTDGSALPLIPLAVDRGMAVLVFTVWDDDDRVYQALESGAGGYLLKGDASAGRVAEALAVLKDGGAPISPTIARRLLDDLRLRGPKRDEGSAPNLPSLTDREREIVDLFSKGATYDEVASMLSVSVNTIRYHVRSLYKKLHVCSKAEAVTLALHRS